MAQYELVTTKEDFSAPSHPIKVSMWARLAGETAVLHDQIVFRQSRPYENLFRQTCIDYNAERGGNFGEFVALILQAVDGF